MQLQTTSSLGSGVVIWLLSSETSQLVCILVFRAGAGQSEKKKKKSKLTNFISERANSDLNLALLQDNLDVKIQNRQSEKCKNVTQKQFLNESSPHGKHFTALNSHQVVCWLLGKNRQQESGGEGSRERKNKQEQ